MIDKKEDETNQKMTYLNPYLEEFTKQLNTLLGIFITQELQSIQQKIESTLNIITSTQNLPEEELKKINELKEKIKESNEPT